MSTLDKPRIRYEVGKGLWVCDEKWFGRTKEDAYNIYQHSRWSEYVLGQDLHADINVLSCEIEHRSV